MKKKRVNRSGRGLKKIGRRWMRSLWLKLFAPGWVVKYEKFDREK